MPILSNTKERTRFSKFLVVGTLGAIVDFGIMNILTHFFHISLVIAGIISFSCAVLNNFLWNRYWTYPDSRSRKASLQLMMFLIVSITGVVIRIPILATLEQPAYGLFSHFDLPGNITPDIFAKNSVLAIAVGFVMIWNYLINRYWTYNDIDG